MPAYTYVCEKCGVQFEAFASIKKKETGWQPECPECGSPRTRQTFTAVAIIGGSRQLPSDGRCCSPGRGQIR